MKVIAINGSPRKEGNTFYLIKHVLDELDKEGLRIMRNLGQNMAWLLKKLYSH